MPPLFVYGTLRFPAVLRELLGRVPAMTPARAEGWRVAALDGRVYPGLVPGPGSADGLLLHGLTPAERATLDAYEGPEYQARTIRLQDGGEALAYLWLGETLPADWDPRDFETRHLGAYRTSG